MKSILHVFSSSYCFWRTWNPNAYIWLDFLAGDVRTVHVMRTFCPLSFHSLNCRVIWPVHTEHHVLIHGQISVFLRFTDLDPFENVHPLLVCPAIILKSGSVVQRAKFIPTNFKPLFFKNWRHALELFTVSLFLQSNLLEFSDFRIFSFWFVLWIGIPWQRKFLENISRHIRDIQGLHEGMKFRLTAAVK